LIKLYVFIKYEMRLKNYEIYEHISSMKINNINDLNYKFNLKFLKYKLKSGLMTCNDI
jgi:hypothetical protein